MKIQKKHAFKAAWLLSALLSAPALAYTLPDSALSSNAPTDTWATYHGDYTAERFSPLTAVNQDTVKNLKQAWSFTVSNVPTPRGQAFGIKSSPLVVNGILYFTVPDYIFAIDARTGKEVWRYGWVDKGGHLIGNRGVAMYKNMVYFMAPDDYIIAVDSTTGKQIWSKQIADSRLNYYTNTAPVVYGGHLLIGVGGDAADLRISMMALDPMNGDIQWTWHPTPDKGDPGFNTWPNAEAALHGGAGMWVPGSFDPTTRMIYWGTGNANPVFNGSSRPGDNKWTASIVALNVDTGKFIWGHQVTPHETHDWDNVTAPTLFDATINGQPRKLLVQTSVSGVLTVLDRVTGKSIVTKPLAPAHTTWFKQVNANGEPIPLQTSYTQVAGTLIGAGGSVKWESKTYSPKTGLLYASITERLAIDYTTDLDKKPMGYSGMGQGGVTGDSYLKAFDPKTGNGVWQHPCKCTSLMSTAGGLIFSTDGTGDLVAYRDTDGKPLWHVPGDLSNPPETVMIDGKQWLFFANGDTMTAYMLP